MNLSRTLLAVVASSLLGLASAPLQAHSDAYLDTQPAPNGGQLRMAGAYHYELTLAKADSPNTQDAVVVFVTDHAGTRIPTAGASGTVTLLSGKGKLSLPLKPDGDNRMKATGKFVSTPEMKVVVSINLAGKSPEQARFTPLASVLASDGHADHKH